MENFVLYEEVGRGEHSIIYKGRRKGTINFVAIHCIDKCKRPQITNLVRLTHEIHHENIVGFHEWYETSNHLWLVVELCTGGSLKTIISQDDHLPESSVRTFGIDAVKGLHHIHSLGIIFSDIKPSKILLDGPGVLKFSDFGMSRVEGENLDTLFKQYADDETWKSQDQSEISQADEIPKQYRLLGCPIYMAPEVIETGKHTIPSDIWSLGCVLYEMFTGHPPFLADNFHQLVEKISTQQLSPPRVKGSRVSAKPSPEFTDLLSGMLQKDPHKRLSWGGLVTHVFWQGALQHLVRDLETDAEVLSMRESLRQSIANFSVRASSTSELPKGNSVLGQVHGVHIDTQRDELQTEDLSIGEDRTDSVMSTTRPMTAPGGGDGKVNFTISSRPHTAATQEPDELLMSPHTRVVHSPGEVKEEIRRAHKLLHEVEGEERREVSQLIYHTSDFTVTPVVDNPKILKPSALKYDHKIVPVPPFSAEKINSLSTQEQVRHINLIMEQISIVEKGPASQKRLQLLNYIGSIASDGLVANLLVKYGMLVVLARQIKESQQVEMKNRFGRILGLVANNASDVDEETNLTEPTSILTELLRDNIRNGKLKVAILPALGELLYLIASQEEIKSHPVTTWTVPPMTYTMLIRCLREGEDAIVNHITSKIIENVATTSGVHSQKFAVNEVGQLIWYVFTHATADSLRATALSALCRLSKHNINLFTSVIEKVGLPKMLSTMALPISRIQQAVITMFAMLFVSDARLTRFIQDKDLTPQVMRLLESPSVVIRGKAFLVLLELIKNNKDVLLKCCNNKLVMYIERDCRRQAPGKAENQSHLVYLGRCMDLLIGSLTDMIPDIIKEILECLDQVSGRKHPSTTQVKQLKSCLPMMPVILHFVTSQIFRPKIVNETFLKQVGELLVHVRSIDSGSTQISAATVKLLGATGTEEFIHTVFGILETLAQHPTILTDRYTLVTDSILPNLAVLVSSSAGDTRALSLRLFSEIVTIFLSQHEYESVQLHKNEVKKLHHIIADTLLPQYEQLLLEQDPLPSYALKLLLSLLEQNPVSIKHVEKLGLVPVIFQVLVDHQSNPVSSTMQNLAAILNCLVSHKETNMKELYDQGLVDHFSSLFIEVTAICTNPEENSDLKSPNSVLLSLLDSLHAILKYVSDVVRKALQAKKTGGNREAEIAENLLLINKPFTDLMSLLTHLLVHEDSEISDTSLKSLSLLVQLFGGEHSEAMTPDNMDCYSEALKKADAKKQKVILRIVKRMITTEKTHVANLQRHGVTLLNTIKGLVHTASSTADMAITTLAGEILRVGGDTAQKKR